jgi:hypothetical protein
MNRYLAELRFLKSDRYDRSAFMFQPDNSSYVALPDLRAESYG